MEFFANFPRRTPPNETFSADQCKDFHGIMSLSAVFVCKWDSKNILHFPVPYRNHQNRKLWYLKFFTLIISVFGLKGLAHTSLLSCIGEEIMLEKKDYRRKAIEEASQRKENLKYKTFEDANKESFLCKSIRKEIRKPFSINISLWNWSR